MKNILELLEKDAQRLPEKVAFADDVSSVTYASLHEKCRRIGSALLKMGKRNAPIAVLTQKSVGTLEGMFGTIYSGNFYVVVDCESPNDRIEKILTTLLPAAIIADESNLEKAASLGFSCEVLNLSKLVETEIDEEGLQKVRDVMIDTDPVYALFTSGSTGMPKGAVLNHRNVLNYIEWFVSEFDIDENTVFGNQTPFYFSMSVSDVFSTLSAGATLQILPKVMFSFPMNLIKLMNERGVNTIYWVPSALGIIANLKVLEYAKAEKLNKILFAGEVMPVKYLNYWLRFYPDALFANLFGPTETTDICTFYKVNRAFPDDATLPIGNACSNCGVFVLKEDGTEAKPGEEGELYVRGSFLSAGYFGNPEKTAAAFVQNPLNTAYPEFVYKTGDLVYYNKFGELEYVTRKDFQIKHMGYRIELGEVEAAAYAVPELTSAAAIYDAPADRIVLIYTGRKLGEEKVMSVLVEKLPVYMRPNTLVKTGSMPYNQNGKIDRVFLREHYKEMIH